MQALTKFKNVDVIGALRRDTVLFDLISKPIGKRGRPRKKVVDLITGISNTKKKIIILRQLLN